MQRPCFDARRDFNERPIFDMLRKIGADPRRGTEVDIYAVHAEGFGVMLEVKAPGKHKNLRPIQKWLQAAFADRYVVVTNLWEAAAAVGREYQP
jgi:hypothetical protein